MSIASISDGKKTIKLPLPPETIKWLVTGSYAINNVLDNQNPQIRRKYAASTYDLGRILLVSNGLTFDYQPLIKTLTDWAKLQTKLRFNFNTYSIPICFIADISVDVKQWYKGRPAHVEIDIKLIEANPEPKPVFKTPDKKITGREQNNAKSAVKDRLKTPAKRLALGLSPDYEVLVSDLSLVQFSDGNTVKEYDYDEFLELTA